MVLLSTWPILPLTPFRLRWFSARDLTVFTILLNPCHLVLPFVKMSTFGVVGTICNHIPTRISSLLPRINMIIWRHLDGDGSRKWYVLYGPALKTIRGRNATTLYEKTSRLQSRTLTMPSLPKCPGGVFVLSRPEISTPPRTSASYLMFFFSRLTRTNRCCGTHLSQTSHIHLLLLSSTQSADSTKCRLPFIAGDRAIDLAT